MIRRLTRSRGVRLRPEDDAGELRVHGHIRKAINGLSDLLELRFEIVRPYFTDLDGLGSRIHSSGTGSDRSSPTFDQIKIECCCDEEVNWGLGLGVYIRRE